MSGGSGAGARIPGGHRLTRQFDPATLRRANGYLKDNHLESLRYEPERRGGGRLRALVRGSGEAIYEPWIQFRPDGKKDVVVYGSCDCPVNGPCKHQALVLLYVQMFPPSTWPEDVPPAAPAPMPPVSPVEHLEPAGLVAHRDGRAAGQAPNDPRRTGTAGGPASRGRRRSHETRAEAERSFGRILRPLDETLRCSWRFCGRGAAATPGSWIPSPALKRRTSARA